MIPGPDQGFRSSGPVLSALSELFGALPFQKFNLFNHFIQLFLLRCTLRLEFKEFRLLISSDVLESHIFISKEANHLFRFCVGLGSDL